MKLAVGDKIIMTEKANDYAYTKEGSKGVIVEINSDKDCTVEFSNITKGNPHSMTWVVKMDSMKRVKVEIDNEGNII